MRFASAMTPARLRAAGMNIFFPLITIFAVACLIAMMWPRVRRSTGIAKPVGGVLRDVDLGYAELTLPRGWRRATGLNDASPLQAVDPIQGRYVLVLSESRADFEGSIDVHEHSVRTRDILGQSVRLLAVRGPQEREVGGFKAVQYELDAAYRFDLPYVSAHHHRRTPRFSSGAGVVDLFAVRPRHLRASARRFRRASGT